jgi:hypothetical protein
MVLPANHQPTKLMEPGKKSFDSPIGTLRRTAVSFFRLSCFRSNQWVAIALEASPQAQEGFFEIPA